MTEVSKLNRFLAALIDGFIASLAFAIFTMLAGGLGMNFLVYIGYIGLYGYFLFKDALFGGQSIGKKMMKYRAVKEDGSSLAGDFVSSAIRNVTLFVFDWVMVLLDKPRFGDVFAKTKVVNQA